MSRVGKRVSAAGALCLAGVFGLLGADKPTPSGVDLENVSKAVRPQDDLFRHVNGLWIERVKIPAERPLFGSFVELADKAEADIRAIIESSKPEAGGSSKQISDLSASFMDEARVEAEGLKPVEADFARIDAVKDKAGLARVLGQLQREGVGGPFRARVDTDAKKSDQYILSLSQAGLGLPDESYYREAKFKALREAYGSHVERTLALAKLTGASAAGDLETRLARHHWDKVKTRDDTLTYNKFDRKGLDALTPGFDWAAWFDAAGLKNVREVIVAQPDYFEAMARAVDEVPLDVWKAWLKWNVLHAYAPVLPKGFVEENFDFYGKTLTGASEMRPRWKRGVAFVQGAMGEAVGKLYVEKHFPPAAAAKMKGLVANLIEAYREDIKGLDWMSPETKAKALDKLAKFNPKIGHPTTWRDYSKLETKPDDLAGNLRRAEVFETERQIAKLGKPVDRGEWMMTPQTVNAYYNPGMNEIVFPAAILQPPFFDLKADDAVNYGAIGAVIGHEIGHGFDDQGAKYDGDGNLVNWWSESDLREFESRSKALIRQYDGFVPAQVPDQHVNGALTIGENIGDLGGLTIAYKAYKRSLDGKPSPTIDGLTGEQRFFFGWAQAWRSKYRDAELKRRLAVDPHSPTEFRCNGVVRNLTEFYDAFGVKEGDKLWLPADQRVRIW